MVVAVAASCLHELFDHLEVLVALEARLADPDVVGVAKQRLVVRPHVEHHRHHAVRRDPARRDVQRQLPDRNAHPVAAEVAQPKDARAVGDDDHVDVVVRPVVHHRAEVAAVLAREVPEAENCAASEELRGADLRGRIAARTCRARGRTASQTAGRRGRRSACRSAARAPRRCRRGGGGTASRCGCGGPAASGSSARSAPSGRASAAGSAAPGRRGSSPSVGSGRAT